MCFDPPEAYTPDEIRSIFETLTDAQKTRLMKLAWGYASKIGPSHAPPDLVNEAWLRALDGRRVWPRSVGVVKFMDGVMRSIAWEWRANPGHADVDPDTIPTSDPSVEMSLEMKKILTKFNDDPIAQKMITGLAEGLRGEELKLLCELTEKEYETIRKKIRRRLEKLGFRRPP